ncbi:MAG TPA: polysaccharide biosynthesis/export family protein [Longimicrobiaceae bacterium]|jgi:protein involved in polysaccharide export with SLBB domain|nr:polysaccharide biosynthesis/export family protein [Longimicrobiaceae bacterium]
MVWSALAAVMVLGAASGVAAQSVGDAQQPQLSRARLQEMLTEYQRLAASPAYSGEKREEAQRAAALIRARLTEGDFQIGDLIGLSVQDEKDLSGSFVVQDGPKLALPGIGDISLRGVLRSELESYLHDQLARYIRDPVVHARSSIRIMITGSVGKSGYFVVPTDAVFSDLFNIAGGTAPNARLNEVRVERANQTIWGGDALQQAIIQGRTIDQLSLRAGDHVIVPAARNRSAWSIVRDGLAILTPVLLIVRYLHN